MKWRCTGCGLTINVEPSHFPITHCRIRHEYPRGVIHGGKSLPAAAKQAQRPKTPCAHRGEETRLQECSTCKGKTLIKIFACPIHGECSMSKPLAAITCCEACPDYQPYHEIATRNLIYHVCPLSANDGWRHNVRQLLRRWNVFNGRRIIAIAHGEGCEWGQVHAEFRGEDYEFFYVENDCNLREVASFRELLERVANTNHDEATFYAHTKGNSTMANKIGAVRWRNAMYRHLLEENFQASMEHLKRHVFVGCHKMVWGDRKPPYPSGLNHGNWFLAGTFFWFRNDVVFGNPRWQNIPRDRYGAEAWPAGIASEHEAASVYQKFDEHQTYTVIKNPYNPALYEGEGLDDPA